MGSRWVMTRDPATLLKRLKFLINIASVAFLIAGTFALTLAATVIIVSSVLDLDKAQVSGLADLTKIIYLMVSGVVSVYGYIELGDVISAVESGRLDGVRESLLIWGLLGLVFGFVVPGVVILLTLTRYYATFIRVITSI